MTNEIKASKRKTVEIVYRGHKLTGRILSVGERTVVFKIDQAKCRAMILDADKVKTANNEQ